MIKRGLVVFGIFICIFLVACVARGPFPTESPENYTEVTMKEGVSYELFLQTPPDGWSVKFLQDDQRVLGCFKGEALADFVVPGWNHFGSHVFYVESATEYAGWRILFPEE